MLAVGAAIDGEFAIAAGLDAHPLAGRDMQAARRFIEQGVALELRVWLPAVSSARPCISSQAVSCLASISVVSPAASFSTPKEMPVGSFGSSKRVISVRPVAKSLAVAR